MLLVDTIRGSGRTTKQLILAGGLALGGQSVCFVAASEDSARHYARYFCTLFPDAEEWGGGEVRILSGRIYFYGQERFQLAPQERVDRCVTIEDHAVTEAHPINLMTKCLFPKKGTP